MPIYTYYAPGAGGSMEGPWATSRPNPLTGRYDQPFTLDDYRLNKAPFVTVASDPSRYGEKVNLGTRTYRSPVDNQTYTLENVPGVIHDTGSAFRGRPDKLDIAVGDFRGWDPAAAERFVGGGNSASGGGKMPGGLLDFLQPSQPDNSSIGDRLAANSNSLIGMGMGLLQPTNPWAGTNAWSNALQGYQSGAALDQRTAALRQQQAQDAWKKNLAEKQYGLEVQKFLRGGEGDWTIVDAGNDLFPQKRLFNKRTMEFRDIPGSETTAATAAPTRAPSPFDAGGGGGVPYAGGGGPFNVGTQAPSAPAAATSASATAQPPDGVRNEAYLRSLGPNTGTLVKGVAEYEIDPNTLDAKHRAQVVTAAKMYRPDYSTAEYQKRGQPPSGEVQARIGLGRAFLDKLDDRTDDRGNSIAGLKSRIANGELNGTVANRGLAYLGQGGPGEIRRAIDEGADALLRGLTGAGMGNIEAGNYARRYQFSPIDTQETAMRKLNELETALRYTSTEVGKGRGGDDFTKGYKSKFGEATAGEPTASSTRTGGANLPGQPKPGFQKDGYVFKGGDPSKQENWAPVR